MKKLLKSETGRKIIIFVGSVIVLALIVGIVFLINSNTSKIISVDEVNGMVSIVGEKKAGKVYKGKHLHNGDDVTVEELSGLTLKMNKDKYLYADEKTHFKLESDSSKAGNKIKINLYEGSVVNVLTSKLGDGDSYQVDTPTATMTVRGTRFRVASYSGIDGSENNYTLLEVESGVVYVQLKSSNGSYNGVEKEFYAGQSTLIQGNGSSTEFMTSQNIKELPDYNNLPQEGISRIIELLPKVKGLGNNSSDSDILVVAENDIEDPETVETDTDKVETTEENKEENIEEIKEEKNTDNKDSDKNVTDNKDTKENKDTKDNKDTKETKDNKDTKTTQNTNNKDNKNTNNNNTNTNKPNTNTQNNNNNEQPENNNQEQPTNNTPQVEHKHSWGDWIITDAPTCEKGGTRKHKCMGCGQEESEPVSPLDHSYSDWTVVTNATCAQEGLEKKVCTRCGKEITQPIGKTNDHNWTETGRSAYELTNSETGAPEMHFHVSYSCSICGATKSEDE